MNTIINFVKDRFTERTSLDGAMLIASGLIFLIMPTDLMAYGAIAYGIWTLIQPED
jgi:hypothetical protein